MSNLSVVEQADQAVEPITPMNLIETAMSQNADIDKLEKLWDLQQRYEQAEARKAFVSAMAKFREKCPSIKKTKEAHNSKYAGLAETIAQIRDAESECGLTHSWRTNQVGSMIEVTCTITHTSGYSESTTLTSQPETSGSKNSIQSIGSAVTYLQRYTLFAILGLASIDDDLDGGNPFEGDCLGAMKSCKTKKDLRYIWRGFSKEQHDKYIKDFLSLAEGLSE